MRSATDRLREDAWMITQPITGAASEPTEVHIDTSA
jgi:hypothetical protein